MATQLSYLALGDSYTIGEAVAQAESFPYQLAEILKKKGINIAPPTVIAKTGWTTDELHEAIINAQITEKFDLVTLLIGVNNQYRGYPLETYKSEFSKLLEMAIRFAAGNTLQVYVVAIPDWSVTEFAKQSGRNLQAISNDIDAFNLINEQETVAKAVSYIDIAPISREAVNNLALIANDGLHPSGKMYHKWAKLIAEKITR